MESFTIRNIHGEPIGVIVFKNNEIPQALMNDVGFDISASYDSHKRKIINFFLIPKKVTSNVGE